MNTRKKVQWQFTPSNNTENLDWEFDNCDVTITSSLPILPTPSWAPLEYNPSYDLVFYSIPKVSQMKPSSSQNQNVDNVISNLLANWDPILDDYYSMLLDSQKR